MLADRVTPIPDVVLGLVIEWRRLNAAVAGAEAAWLASAGLPEGERCRLQSTWADFRDRRVALEATMHGAAAGLSALARRLLFPAGS